MKRRHNFFSCSTIRFSCDPHPNFKISFHQSSVESLVGILVVIPQVKVTHILENFEKHMERERAYLACIPIEFETTGKARWWVVGRLASPIITDHN